jgi:hypothetical protein
MGNLMIFEEMMMDEILKIFFTQMSITSSKMKFFELFKNKNFSSKNLSINWLQSVWPSISLVFANCVASIERYHFFQKGHKKIKN